MNEFEFIRRPERTVCPSVRRSRAHLYVLTNVSEKTLASIFRATYFPIVFLSVLSVIARFVFVIFLPDIGINLQVHKILQLRKPVSSRM